MADRQYKVWAQINLGALKRNYRRIEDIVKARNSTAAIMPIIKADAYGHGMAQVARAAIEAGAAYLAVATAEEGAALRHAGIRDVPVLVLGATALLNLLEKRMKKSEH